MEIILPKEGDENLNNMAKKLGCDHYIFKLQKNCLLN